LCPYLIYLQFHTVVELTDLFKGCHMHVNYQYIMNFLKCNDNFTALKILDYGCGAAELVEIGDQEGLSIYGADVFYEGNNRREIVRDKGLLGTKVKEIEDGKIPFADDYFDIVFSNTVLEHVDSLESVIDEIARVLKPGGMVLNIFPSFDVWWEGHCGIPFLHRFSRNSKYRVWYAYILRSIGFGYDKGIKSKVAWSKDFCIWLDSYTNYRTKREIKRIFDQHFENSQNVDLDYLQFRLSKQSDYLISIFNLMRKYTLSRNFLHWFMEKRAGLFLLSKKKMYK